MQFLVWLKNRGYREANLQGYSDVFKYLEKSVSLNDTEAVEAFIANKKEAVKLINLRRVLNRSRMDMIFQVTN